MSKLQNFISRVRGLKCSTRCREFFGHYCGGLCHRVVEHHVFLLAGGLAFSMFISIVPLVLIVFSVIGSVLAKAQVEGEINTFIERMIPYQDYADFVKELVAGRVEEFRRYKNVAGVIGIVGLLFASSTLFSSMRTILDKVYQVKEEVSLLLGKLRDFGLIVLVLIYFLATTFVLSTWQVVKDLTNRIEFINMAGAESLGGVFFGTFAFVLVLAAFAVIYYIVPYRKPPKKAIFVSALSATILWVLAKELFGYYITHFVMLKRVYGAYAVMIVVAFWIYYTSIVFIIGAEIGQLFRERAAILKARKETVISDAGGG
ncbi:MAG: YihY/virulence factor BrkB family protein [Candidatus Zixiibacteriota bacterium]|nr:MAG: YihY/virulence factor BrkB family protein [candidate division Zixibacteria bacterium]